LFGRITLAIIFTGDNIDCGQVALTIIIANDTAQHMENFCREYLLSVARAFAKANDVTLETVSRQFHGGVYFLRDFENGSVTITLRKYDSMVKAMARHWPKGIAWPKGTIRLQKNYVQKATLKSGG